MTSAATGDETQIASITNMTILRTYPLNCAMFTSLVWVPTACAREEPCPIDYFRR